MSHKCVPLRPTNALWRRLHPLLQEGEGRKRQFRALLAVVHPISHTKHVAERMCATIDARVPNRRLIPRENLQEKRSKAV